MGKENYENLHWRKWSRNSGMKCGKKRKSSLHKMFQKNRNGMKKEKIWNLNCRKWFRKNNSEKTLETILQSFHKMEYIQQRNKTFNTVNSSSCIFWHHWFGPSVAAAGIHVVRASTYRTRWEANIIWFCFFVFRFPEGPKRGLDYDTLWHLVYQMKNLNVENHQR